MPSAGRPRSSAVDHATRQQLDELDALMQRMLSLPVNPPEDSSSPPGLQPPDAGYSENSRASLDACSEADGMASTLVPEQTSPIQAEQPKLEQDAARIEAGLPSPASARSPLPSFQERMESWGYSSPAPLAPASSAFADLDPARPFKVPLVRSAGMQERNAHAPPLAWPLYPLLWPNLAFDRSMVCLGPLGCWLRRPRGRALLGWGGVLLLAVALAWLALDGMGWTW